MNDCKLRYGVRHKTVLAILPLILQTINTAQTLSIGGKCEQGASNDDKQFLKIQLIMVFHERIIERS